MKALLLAAGVGSRLRPYTDDRPKPMVEVGGRPIIAYNLDMLANAGVDEVVINLHYLPDVVKTYVGDGSAWLMHARYSFEETLLGTAGALLPNRNAFATGTFAVVFGDNINELDLREMIAAHRANGAAATVALWERADPSQSGVAELEASGRITRFIEKPQPGESDSHWVNAGVIVAEPILLNAIPAGGAADLGRDVLPALIEGGEPVLGYRMTGAHWWFDRVEDYERAQREHFSLP